MRGQILIYSAETGEGTISGQDGNRYVFKGTEFHGEVLKIRPGTEADFLSAEEGRATDVYPLSAPSSPGIRTNILVGLLAIFLGGFGVHKFYLGYNKAAVTMLICGTIGWILVLPGLAIWLIAFIEGIIYLTKTDEEFEETYIKRERTWF